MPSLISFNTSIIWLCVVLEGGMTAMQGLRLASISSSLQWAARHWKRECSLISPCTTALCHAKYGESAASIAVGPISVFPAEMLVGSKVWKPGLAHFSTWAWQHQGSLSVGVHSTLGCNKLIELNSTCWDFRGKGCFHQQQLLNGPLTLTQIIHMTQKKASRLWLCLWQTLMSGWINSAAWKGNVPLSRTCYISPTYNSECTHCNKPLFAVTWRCEGTDILPKAPIPKHSRAMWIPALILFFCPLWNCTGGACSFNSHPNIRVA